MGISAVLIALNEEKRIAKALEAVKWADETIVVDSGSTDGTVREAERCGARVLRRKFDDFASQKNFAVDNASNEWVLFIDADEIVEKPLAEEVKKAAASGAFDGYMIPRVNIIFGKRMLYGGHQGDAHLRFFRKGKGHFVGPIHERVEISGKIGELTNPLMHYSTASAREYMGKLELYTTLEARYIRQSGRRVTYLDLLARPILVFWKRYFMQAGFRDGLKGLYFYALSSYYVFEKYRKAMFGRLTDERRRAGTFESL